jgi:hypothetical protein
MNFNEADSLLRREKTYCLTLMLLRAMVIAFSYDARYVAEH